MKNSPPAFERTVRNMSTGNSMCQVLAAISKTKGKVDAFLSLEKFFL
jgi:hypothetical protein